VKSPFLLVPWNQSLLHALLRSLPHAESSPERRGNLSSTACIFPNSRPGMYCTQGLKKTPHLARPLLMPGYHTSSGLLSTLRAAIADTPARVASQLDRIGLLMDGVRALPDLADLLHQGSGPEARTLPRTAPLGAGPQALDAVRFFSWGLRLAALFEECLSQAVEPENFLYTEDRATPYATHLLAHLRTLFTQYRARLQERGWTTPGLDAFLVARHIEQGHALPDLPLLGKGLFFCGFYRLTGTENRVFRHIWEQYDATFLLHTDPGRKGNPHWSCAPLSDWVADWKAQSLVFDPLNNGETRVAGPTFTCHEGFDLHSQLEVVQTCFQSVDRDSLVAGPEKEAEKASGPFDADTAVILPDSSLLMPLLHHLPNTDINISMGYPLSRSPLFRLVDSVLRLQENRRYNAFYWKDMLAVLRHPYIKMLQPMDEPGQPGQPAPSLRRELYLFEQELRNDARPYANPFPILHNLYIDREAEEKPAPQVTALLESLFAVLFTRFSEPATTAQLADALTELCHLLLLHGAHLFERFPIDRECLFRLFKSFIPELKTSALAGEVFPSATIFAIARQLMETDRVPFEATPLVGLQVLGMLETRLLSFRHVIIPECTEASLPGISPDDPLLPDSLRREIGLPAGAERETVAAYHFHRLVAGAETVTLLWQEGTQGNGIQDGKKRRSRFVEELIWKEEKRLGRLLDEAGSKEDGLPEERHFTCSTLSSSVGPQTRGRDSIPVTPQIRAQVSKLLAAPLSATLFDTYLTCPARFYYNRILGLAETGEISETKDPRTIGTVLHRTLELFFKARLHAPLENDSANMESHIQEMDAVLKSLPEYLRLENALSADAFTLFTTAAQTRLARLLAEQPPTTVIGLEQRLDATLPLSGSPLLLTGKVDRMDRRRHEEGKEIFTVLDYKTGNIPAPKARLWENDALWLALQGWRPEQAVSAREDILPTLANNLSSVQLPLYILLLSLGAADSPSGQPVGRAAREGRINAAWVDLAETGQECPLFAEDMPCALRMEAVREKLPLLIGFLARHMNEAPVYYPVEGPHCSWCPYAARCLVCADK